MPRVGAVHAQGSERPLSHAADRFGVHDRSVAEDFPLEQMQMCSATRDICHIEG
jgi:hypothetical protein